ncbi:MAG: hypothetical protein H6726_23540 [Sandaracinaceae bacterium]|nr:hypothetical protein [Sandaracinaceae bacterium]
MAKRLFKSLSPDARVVRRLASDAERDRVAADAWATASDETLLGEATRTREASTPAPLRHRMGLAIAAIRRGAAIDPHPEQIMAARALMTRCVAQVHTGEGKTISGALAAACHALGGQRVTMVTTNDYLAARDAAIVQPALARLGLPVGHVEERTPVERRRIQHAAAVVYTSLAQLGFDFLRDQLVMWAADRVLAPPGVALIDEADAILVDEMSTPINVARTSKEAGPALDVLRDAVERLRPSRDFEFDRETEQALLTPEGEVRLVALLADAGVVPRGADPAALFAPALAASVFAALHVHAALRRDEHYLVQDGHITLIDAATGRPQPHRRLMHGLQAALEWKERVPARPRTDRVTSVSTGALLRRYPHVAGMTGTAAGIDEELAGNHDLGVIRIPPHRPCVRRDITDAIFRSDRARRAALCDETVLLHERGVPVLIGAPNEQAAAAVAADLRARQLTVSVLSAKAPAEEARVIADAGRPFAVTVATPLAGRGVDVRLGGVATHAPGPGGVRTESEDARAAVVALGGLAVLGYGRRSARRLDDQLRGRAARQGEPGWSRFYVSLDDPELQAVDDHDELRALRRGALRPDDERAARDLVDILQERATRRAAGHRMARAALDGVLDELRAAFFRLRFAALAGHPLGGDEEGPCPDAGDGDARDAWQSGASQLVQDLVRDARSRRPPGSPLHPWSLARHLERAFGVYVALPPAPVPVTFEPELVRALQCGVVDGLDAQWRRALRVTVRASLRSVEPRRVDDAAATAERGPAALGIPLAALSDPAEMRTAVSRRVSARLRRRFGSSPRRWVRFFRLSYVTHLDAQWVAAQNEMEVHRDDAALAGASDARGLHQLRVTLHGLWGELLARVEDEVARDLLTIPAGRLDALEDWELAAGDARGPGTPWRVARAPNVPTS